MDHAEITALVQGFAPAVRDWVQEAAVDPIVEKIKALEARITELERRPPGVEYRGVWRDDGLYPAGSLVTHNGGLWVARTATAARPGGPDWVLVVKSGGANDRTRA